MNSTTGFIRYTEKVIRQLGWRTQFCVERRKQPAMNTDPEVGMMVRELPAFFQAPKSPPPLAITGWNAQPDELGPNAHILLL
jgi:hypothetical protein